MQLATLYFVVALTSSPANLESAFVMDVPPELSRQDVATAIEQAARGRKWNIIQSTDGSISIRLVHRNIDANMHFDFVTIGDSFRVEAYYGAWKLNRKGERVGRENPSGWIENIRKDIAKKLLAIQYVKTTPEWEPLAMSSNELREIFINESTLIDPFSAQFRKVFQRKDNPNVICGQVNSKNRMGAYVGWSLFYVEGSQVLVLGNEPTAADLALVNSRCRGATKVAG